MPISQQIGSSSLAKPGVCTSTTRPASPYEGQMIYETDTDLMLIWTGTVWRILMSAATSGAVLQVLSTNQSSQQTYTTSTPATAGLSVTITPKASNSKILIQAHLNGINRQTGDTGLNAWIYRNGSNLFQFGYLVGKIHGTTTQFNDGTCSCSYLDSPSTTSATTYEVYAASQNNIPYALINHSNSTVSTLTVMEIAG